MNGTATRTLTKCEVNDKKAFVKWCLDNDCIELLDVNLSNLNAHVKSKNGLCVIPGVLINKVESFKYSLK